MPRNGIVLVGGLALIGAAIMEFFSDQLGGSAYAVGAQALNFGAFIAFMGVNAASFVHYWWRGKSRTWSHFLVPVLGFLICGFIWVHLSRAAMILGAVWMTAGILYGAIRTRGFPRRSGEFRIPPEEA